MINASYLYHSTCIHEMGERKKKQENLNLHLFRFLLFFFFIAYFYSPLWNVSLSDIGCSKMKSMFSRYNDIFKIKQ